MALEILNENKDKPAEQTISGGIVAIFDARFYGDMTENDRDVASNASLYGVSGYIGVEPIRQVVEEGKLSTIILLSSIEDEIPANAASPNVLQRIGNSVVHIAEAKTPLTEPPKAEVITGGKDIVPARQALAKPPKYLVTIYSTASAPEEPLREKFFNNPKVLKRAA